MTTTSQPLTFLRPPTFSNKLMHVRMHLSLFSISVYLDAALVTFMLIAFLRYNWTQNGSLVMVANFSVALWPETFVSLLGVTNPGHPQGPMNTSDPNYCGNTGITSRV